MRITSNTSAIAANNSLGFTDAKLSVSTERLSSGNKINAAKDNPSGLAIAKRMNAQLKGLSTASQNAKDSISLVEIADGALSEIQSIVQRMSELAVKAGNGILTDADRSSIQAEISQLTDEIERIADDTDFNGMKLLNGDCDLQGYSSDSLVDVNYYSDETEEGLYRISAINPVYNADGVLQAGSVTLLQDGSPNAFPSDATITYDKNRVTVIASNSFEVQFDLDSTITTLSNVDLELTGEGSMTMQIGANEGQTLDIRIPKITLANMDIDDIDLSTAEGAEAAGIQTKNANAYISSIRSKLGAYENRLEKITSNLDIANENITSAYSRIMDVDMATEMTTYSTLQILSQAGTSMLAQANERPQQVLQLLQ